MKYEIRKIWNKSKTRKMKNYNIKKNNKIIKKLIKVSSCLVMIIFLLVKNNFIKYEENNIKSKTKVCLCCIAKMENLYISEFVEHYKSIGYNHIYLYDNNDINGERFDDVIKDKITSGFVTVLNFRGYRGGKDNAQMDAYYDCFNRFNSKCNWISFFDIDEYLFINPLHGKNRTIQEMLDNPKYDDCENVKINWKSYSDSGKLYYENKPLTERFTEFSKFRYEFGNVKPTIRTNISKNRKRTYSPHTVYRNIKGCLSSGRRKQFDFYQMPADYGGAYIKHFVTKTISEYCNKTIRGHAMITFVLNKGKLGERFNYFFTTNKKTQEKVDIFNKIFNTTFK
jgi:hypothetical protein